MLIVDNLKNTHSEFVLEREGINFNKIHIDLFRCKYRI